MVEGNGVISQQSSTGSAGILTSGERAQVLATLIQTQESTTWLVFSLAIATEGVLLAAFCQERVADHGRSVIALAGLLLMIAMFLIVRRSNKDMATLYERASNAYPEVFDLGRRSKSPRARTVMIWMIIVSIIGWLAIVFADLAWDSFSNMPM